MIERVLADINKVPGVMGSLVTGRDGLLISSSVPKEIDPEAIGAFSTAVYSTAETSVKEMDQGELSQVILEGEDGKTLMISAGDGILVVLTESKVNLGYLRMEMKKSVDRIRAALS